jgi:hypothetical protein
MSIEDVVLVYVGLAILELMNYSVPGWLWFWPVWVGLGFMCSLFIAHLMQRNPIIGFMILCAYGYGLYGVLKHV